MAWSTRRSAWLVPALLPAALCCGRETELTALPGLYRAGFQFKLNNGNYYSGYWEMDIHFRKKIEMPAPYVVKFWDETWYSDAFGWHFYEREEVEQSTYDGIMAKGGEQVIHEYDDGYAGSEDEEIKDPSVATLQKALAAKPKVPSPTASMDHVAPLESVILADQGIDTEYAVPVEPPEIVDTGEILSSLEPIRPVEPVEPVKPPEPTEHSNVLEPAKPTELAKTTESAKPTEL